MMGLLTGYQDDAERVERKAKQQMAVGNRRVDRLNTEAAGYNARSDAYNAQVGSYNKESENLKGLLAGPQKTIEDYNAQVEGFKRSAIRYSKGGEDVLWEIIGWTNGGQAWQPVKYQGGNYSGDLWMSGQLGYAPYASDVRAPIGGAQWQYGFQPYLAPGGLHIGGHVWGDSPTATIRTSSDGTPISSMGNTGSDFNPIGMYASRNDQPFVAPLKQSQVDAAKAADALLTSKKGEIDSIKARGAEIEEAGKKTKAEGDAIKAKGDIITARNERVAKQSEREAARLESDVEMNKRRIAEEQQGAQQSGSVFDQNMAGVHQSISAWLNA
jgi:hypothetical protein